MTDFLAALGLAFALEGVIYALAPAAMKNFMQRAQEAPEFVLRMGGLGAAALGVAIVWLARG